MPAEPTAEPTAEPSPPSPTGRAYAGRAPDERRAERRRRLLDAGLEVFGTVGWEAASIALLCATARVATRSFYEEFEDREALLREVATTVVLDAVEDLRAALDAAPATVEGKVRAGLSAYVGHLTADPRRARVAYRAAPAAGRLLDDRHRASLAFAEVIGDEADRLGVRRPEHGDLLALALTGAVAELIAWWAATTPSPPVEPIVDELTRLFVAAVS
jgi:AcrR family transcriptional regulator